MKKIISTFQRDRFVYAFYVFLILVILCFSKCNRGDIRIDPFLYFWAVFKAIVISLAVCFVLYYFVLLCKRELRPLKKYWEKIVMAFRMRHEVVNFMFLMCFMTIVFSCYTSLKGMIPSIVPFYLDPQLARFDQSIHFGLHGWQITHAIFTTPHSTAIINFFYNIWFYVCWIYLIYFMLLFDKPNTRKQVLVCFFGAWVLNGGIFAIGLSSVGPAFYEIVYSGSDLFVPLMERLNEQNNILIETGAWNYIWAIKTQDILWDSYVAGELHFGSGISAMPSMHVSISVLMALSLYRVNKYVCVVAWCYVVVILIGSVHLAWHYAVDGYFSIIFTSVLWFVVGWLQEKRSIWHGEEVYC